LRAIREAGRTGSDDPIRKATINRECDLLLALLDHFRLDPKHEDKWMLLALRLARNHVPAFTFTWTRRGRKPKRDFFTKLLARHKARKPGRPRTWTDLDYRILLADRDWGARWLREHKPHVRITDVAALTVALTQFSNGDGKNRSESSIRIAARSGAKRLSDARKFVRKPPGLGPL